MKCLSFKTLFDYWEGALHQRAEEKVKAHLLEGCERCAQDLTFLEEVLGRVRRSHLKKPSNSLVKKVSAITKKERGSGLVRRLVAELALDNRRLPGYAEVRTGGIKPFYLLYRAQGVDLDLLIQPANIGDKGTILGQVSQKGGEVTDLQSAEVRLVQGQIVVKSTRTDHWGEFAFMDLAPGGYSLRLDLGMREVEVKDLQVEEAF